MALPMLWLGAAMLLKLLPLLLLTAAFGAAAAEADLGAARSLASASAEAPVPSGALVGGVVIGSNARYQGQDDLLLPVPGMVYFGDQLLYLGDRARYYFHQDSDFSAFGYGRFRPGNLDPQDTPELAGMDKRKWQLEGGLGASLITPYALLTTRLTSDLTGTSNGQELLLWSDFPLMRDRLLVMPGCGLMWRSSKLANYYFGGVSADEATAERPVHDTGDTWSLMASLVTSYRLNADWLVTLSGSVEQFDEGSADSPLIDHEREYVLLAGVGYVW